MFLFSALLRPFFRGPSLPLRTREAVARTVVRTSIPLIVVMVLFAGGVIVVLTGFDEPQRLLMVVITLLSMVPSVVQGVRKRWLSAGTWLVLACTVSTNVAVLVNSVHAPLWLGNLVLLVIAVPLHGVRGGLFMATVATLSGAAWLVMHSMGWSTLTFPSHVFALVMSSMLMFIGVYLAGVPTTLLGQALATAQERVAESERSQERAKESEIALRAIFEQAEAAVVLLEPDGTIARMNPAATALLGVAGRSMFRRPVLRLEWWTDVERAQIAAALDDARAGRRTGMNVVRQPLSEESVYNLVVQPCNDGEGDLRYVLLELHDVTELVRTRAQLESARRLEALGQLAGGVAHDFNNMLSAIISSSDLVRAEGLLSAQGEQNMQVIDAASRRAADLTRKLLAFGRRDRFDSNVVDVDRLVTELVPLAKRAVGASVELTTDLGDGGHLVVGDGSSLEHAVFNLVLNARDAMPDGGELRISVDHERVDQAWCDAQAFDVEPGPVVRLQISDTGMGMPADTLARSFEPFFTTKEDGTGLGLAAVHGAVCTHHGAILIESEVDRGTTFSIYLPAADATEVIAPVSMDCERSVGSAEGTVLVVEDDRIVARATQSLVRSLGFDVVLAVDGIDAREVFMEHRDVIVGVFSDMRMPRSGGVQLAGWLYRIAPDVPVILTSGFPDQEFSTSLPESNVVAVLAKPFGRQQLLDLLLHELT